MEENVYQQPDAEIGSHDSERKRPILVWVILVLYCLGIFGIISHFAMAQGVLPMEGPMKAYYGNLGIIDHALIVLTYGYGLFCAIMLFRLKAVALWLYLAEFPLYVVQMIYTLNHEAFRAMIEAQGSSMTLTFAPSLVVLVLIVLYVWHLKRKGRLH